MIETVEECRECPPLPCCHLMDEQELRDEVLRQRLEMKALRTYAVAVSKEAIRLLTRAYDVGMDAQWREEARAFLKDFS